MYIFCCTYVTIPFYLLNIYKNQNMICTIEFTKLYSEYNNIKIRIKTCIKIS